MVIAGEKGTLRCDMVEGVIETFSVEHGEWRVENIPFDVNTMYLGEMAHFLDCIANKKRPVVDIADGYKTLKLAIDIKKLGGGRGGDICLTG
jgi:predicted dehydrogenase